MWSHDTYFFLYVIIHYYHHLHCYSNGPQSTTGSLFKLISIDFQCCPSFFLSISFLSCTMRYSKLILYSPCPALGSVISPRTSGFFIREWHLEPKIWVFVVFSVTGVITCRLSQQTKLKKICICKHEYIFIYIYIHIT